MPHTELKNENERLSNPLFFLKVSHYLMMTLISGYVLLQVEVGIGKISIQNIMLLFTLCTVWLVSFIFEWMQKKSVRIKKYLIVACFLIMLIFQLFLPNQISSEFFTVIIGFVLYLMIKWGRNGYIKAFECACLWMIPLIALVLLHLLNRNSIAGVFSNILNHSENFSSLLVLSGGIAIYLFYKEDDKKKRVFYLINVVLVYACSVLVGDIKVNIILFFEILILPALKLTKIEQLRRVYVLFVFFLLESMYLEFVLVGYGVWTNMNPILIGEDMQLMIMILSLSCIFVGTEFEKFLSKHMKCISNIFQYMVLAISGMIILLRNVDIVFPEYVGGEIINLIKVWDAQLDELILLSNDSLTFDVNSIFLVFFSCIYLIEVFSIVKKCFVTEMNNVIVLPIIAFVQLFMFPQSELSMVLSIFCLSVGKNIENVDDNEYCFINRVPLMFSFWGLLIIYLISKLFKIEIDNGSAFLIVLLYSIYLVYVIFFVKSRAKKDDKW